MALKWIWKSAGRYRATVVVLTVLGSLASILTVGYAWALRGLVDDAAASKWNGIVVFAAAMVLIRALTICLRAASRHLSEDVRSGFENSLKRKLFSNALNKDYFSVASRHSGEWMTRLADDTRIVADSFTQILPEAVALITQLIAAFVMMLTIIPIVTLAMLPLGAAVIAFTYYLRKKLKAMHKSIQEKDGRLRVFMTERLSNLMIVKSYAREEIAEERAAELMEEHREARMARNRFSNFANSGFAAVMSGISTAAAIYCAILIFQGKLSYGSFAAVTALVGFLQTPIAGLSAYVPKYYAMLGSADRLRESESWPDDGADAAAEPEQAKSKAAKFKKLTPSECRRFYEDGFEGISARNVRFMYPDEDEDGREALVNLSMDIEKGDFVALTGSSGSGKSTILKLLMCLYTPQSGEILLLSKEGAKQHEAFLHPSAKSAGAFPAETPISASFRNLFAYVPQGNQLMSGTIREIVAFGEEPCDEEVWKALRTADAEEFTRELDDGIYTRLGERGQGLSEGQVQRIAVARAIYSRRPILLLDEATSSLDEATEERLLNNLRSMTDLTVLIVTHRPAALKICTKTVEFSQ